MMAMLLVALAATIALLFRRSESRRIASATGYLLVASLTSMAVAILADGRHEIEKHLYLANLLFDMTVLGASLGAATGLARWRREQLAEDHALVGGRRSD